MALQNHISFIELLNSNENTIYFFMIKDKNLAIKNNILYYYDDKFKLNSELPIITKIDNGKRIIHDDIILDYFTQILQINLKENKIFFTSPEQENIFNNLPEIKKGTNIKCKETVGRVDEIIYDYDGNMIFLDLNGVTQLIEYDKENIFIIDPIRPLKDIKRRPLKTLTELLTNAKRKRYYFKLKDSNFAIDKNELYFFDNKFKINFGYNIFTNKKELIGNTLITQLFSNNIKFTNNKKLFNTNHNVKNNYNKLIDFDKLEVIEKGSKIDYDGTKDIVNDITYDYDDDNLLLDLKDKGVVNYRKDSFTLIKDKLKIGNKVIYGTNYNKVYTIANIRGKTVEMKDISDKKFLLSKLKEYDPNKKVTDIKRVENKPIYNYTVKKLENIGLMSDGKSAISSGYVYGTRGFKKNSRIIYKKGDPKKLYYLNDFIGNDKFKIISRDITGNTKEKEIIVKKNEIESANRIEKDDIVVLKKENFVDPKKYLKVKSANLITANLINSNNTESTILKNKLFKIQDSKFIKKDLAIKKGYLRSTELTPGSRVIYKKGDPNKKYTIKIKHDNHTVKLSVENGKNPFKDNIFAKISDIENAHIIKKGNIVSEKDNFFKKNKHYTVQSIDKSTANVINKENKPKTLLLDNLYKVSNSKNKVSNSKNKKSSIFNRFTSNNRIKKNSKIVYNRKEYTVKDIPRKSIFGNISHYTLVNSKGIKRVVDSKELKNNLTKPNVKSKYQGRITPKTIY